MIQIVADNDVRGAVRRIQRVIQSRAWREFADEIGVTFSNLEELGLTPNSTDEEVWRTCQAAGAILRTANRAADPQGLESAIRRYGDQTSLPVITIANAQRVVRDRQYAIDAALRLLQILKDLDHLRGTGRLYVP